MSDLNVQPVGKDASIETVKLNEMLKVVQDANPSTESVVHLRIGVLHTLAFDADKPNQIGVSSYVALPHNFDNGLIFKGLSSLIESVSAKAELVLVAVFAAAIAKGDEWRNEVRGALLTSEGEMPDNYLDFLRASLESRGKLTGAAGLN